MSPNAVLAESNDDGEACIYFLAATDLIVDAYTDWPRGRLADGPR